MSTAPVRSTKTPEKSGRILRFAAGAVAVTVAGAAASGDIVKQGFINASATGHKAAAMFVFNDANGWAKVTIANLTGPAFSDIESRALTGVFFDVTNGAFPIKKALGKAGPSVTNPGNFNPTQLWSFSGPMSATATPFGSQFGLAAAGLDHPNSGMLAPGGPGTTPGGLDGGILSATGSPYTGSAEGPMFRSFVTFFFKMDQSFFANGLHSIHVHNVHWQFGESFGEASIHVVPLPPAAGVGVAGLMGVAFFGFLRRRALRRAV